jgi:hypothetical protein
VSLSVDEAWKLSGGHTPWSSPQVVGGDLAEPAKQNAGWSVSEMTEGRSISGCGWAGPSSFAPAQDDKPGSVEKPALCNVEKLAFGGARRSLPGLRVISRPWRAWKRWRM